MHFKCKPTTKMEMVINTYCQRQGHPASAVRFLFDGERINQEQTCAEVGLEDGDSIDVTIEQVGGGRF